MRDDQRSGISKEEYFLLLDSYRNMIESYSTLFSQQQKTFELLQNFLASFKEHENLSYEDNKILTEVDNNLLDLIDCADKNQKSANGIMSDIKNNIGMFEQKSVSFYNKIVNRTNIAYAGMISIIITLLSVIILLLKVH